MAGDLVLLTGATGMIGYRVLVQLLESGYQVRVAVRNLAGYERVRDLKPTLPYSTQMSPIVVPDITIPGAYDEAVVGVKYVIHVASPLAANVSDGIDCETEMIQPAIRGTIGMLESANKVGGVQRIVITASILSIIGFADLGSEEIFDETHRTTPPEGYLTHKDLAYTAAKVRTYEASYQWVKDHKPVFDIINIEPSFVLGRDDTVTDPSQVTKGTNRLIMAPLLGLSMAPYPGSVVHLDDVASMHVRALDSKVAGNQDFLATSHQPKGIEWTQLFDIVKERYPKECAEGIFKVDTPERPQTYKLYINSSKAEKTFSMTFKSFEEQVVSVVEHYLELLGQASK